MMRVSYLYSSTRHAKGGPMPEGLRGLRGAYSMSAGIRGRAMLPGKRHSGNEFLGYYAPCTMFASHPQQKWFINAGEVLHYEYRNTSSAVYPLTPGILHTATVRQVFERTQLNASATAFAQTMLSGLEPN
eukprot:scaffold2355_cov382-Prasinococcus_capsulatus_cf.AAC.16